MISNIEAAKKLVKTYRSITREQLCKFTHPNHWNQRVTNQIMAHLTGFGEIDKCSLCRAAPHRHNEPICEDCIHALEPQSTVAPYCIDHPTYGAIERAETVDDLLEALAERADYLETLIKKAKSLQ